MIYRTTSRNWMRELSKHCRTMRAQFPEEKLLVLFDVYGTILDTRFHMLNLLKAYDRKFGTNYFIDFELSDITETDIKKILESLRILDNSETEKILAWYNKNNWTQASHLQSTLPLPGVLELIRWLRIENNTFVGLHTGRKELLRKDTLKILNVLGESYDIDFSNEFLFMSEDRDTNESKIQGLRYFQNLGYKVIAVIDNEPKTLRNFSQTDNNHEILLLHARTIYQSKWNKAHPMKFSGKHYDLKEIIEKDSLPKVIDYVWHGINSKENLNQFIASSVVWGEVDVRFDSLSNKLFVRHDSFKESPLMRNEQTLFLKPCLERINKHDRSIKFDLKEGGDVLKRVADLAAQFTFSNEQIWFNGDIDTIREDGFRWLSKNFPNSTIQCAGEYLTPLIIAAPDKAKEIFEMFKDWGITRISIKWNTSKKSRAFKNIKKWGLEVNLYGVPDLDSFLRATLFLPDSITTDFNFPEWAYYGQGSGKDLKHYQYAPQRQT